MAEVMKKTIQNDILDKAMHLFWQSGYSQLSIANIVKATGLNRAAIYQHFGSKEHLYEAILQHYIQRVTPEILQPLNNDHQPISAIKDFFCQFITSLNDHPVKYRGCLVLATAMQPECQSSRLDEIINHFWHDIQTKLVHLLQSAQQQGLCSSACHCQQTASFLMGNLIGLLTSFQMHVATQWVNEQIMMINQYLDQLTQARSI